MYICFTACHNSLFPKARDLRAPITREKKLLSSKLQLQRYKLMYAQNAEITRACQQTTGSKHLFYGSELHYGYCALKKKKLQQATKPF